MIVLKVESLLYALGVENSDALKHLREIKELPDLRGAHTIDIIVRMNGVDRRYEADFLKYLQDAFRVRAQASRGGLLRPESQTVAVENPPEPIRVPCEHPAPVVKPTGLEE